jgi:hypothetical protein
VFERPYHGRGMDAHERAEERRKARERATATGPRRDHPASVFLGSGSPLEAVMCDVEHAALERIRGDGRGQPRGPQGYRVGVAQLEATMAGVRAAHAGGDQIGLRGELVNLAAQAAEMAAQQPVPIQRRARANAAA